MTQDNEGYLQINFSLFGSDVFGFRLAVDDFKTKWALVGLGSIAALTFLAVEVKENFF